MAQKKIRLEGNPFDDLIARLDELGSNDAIERGVEAALKASKELVNNKLNIAMIKGNLPAGGRYSTGKSKESIDTDMNVKWQGLKASIDIGFDLKKAPYTIWLMFGAPRRAPVPGLKDAVYGRKTQSEIKKLQIDEINKVIKRITEG